MAACHHFDYLKEIGFIHNTTGGRKLLYEREGITGWRSRCSRQIRKQNYGQITSRNNTVLTPVALSIVKMCIRDRSIKGIQNFQVLLPAFHS